MVGDKIRPNMATLKRTDAFDVVHNKYVTCCSSTCLCLVSVQARSRVLIFHITDRVKPSYSVISGSHKLNRSAFVLNVDIILN